MDRRLKESGRRDFATPERYVRYPLECPTTTLDRRLKEPGRRDFATPELRYVLSRHQALVRFYFVRLLYSQ